jgi:hypothetical protein
MRIISGQTTKLSRTMHGIVYNEKRDELVVPVALAGAILTFKGDVNGSQPPIRIIQGPKTRIVGPDTLYVDPVHEEIFVDSGRDSILVFPLLGEGDIEPIREIKGPKTLVANLFGIAVDPVRNVLVVSNRTQQRAEPGQELELDRLLIFDRTATGDVPPLRIISGPKTGIIKLRQLEIDSDTGYIYATIKNNREAYDVDAANPSPWDPAKPGFIGVWSVTDNGDVPPRAVIKGPATQLVWPAGVAISRRHREVYTIDSVSNSLFAFAMPEFFAPKAGTR